jgi:hypothetical protein
MTSNTALTTILTPIINNIIGPGLLFLFGAAFIYFVWGVFKLVRSADNPEERKIGGMHILYSAIGMFIMLGAYGIIRLIANTLNVQSPL